MLVVLVNGVLPSHPIHAHLAILSANSNWHIWSKRIKQRLILNLKTNWYL